MTKHGVRCFACEKKLAEEHDGHLVVTCPRCKTVNVFDTPKKAAVA